MFLLISDASVLIDSKPMSSEIIAEAYMLRQNYSKTSLNDLLAFALAKHENCQLLTGDKALHDVAKIYNLEVHGTIWLVKEMLRHQKITGAIARVAFQRMKDSASRLPWDEVEKMLSKHEKEVLIS